MLGVLVERRLTGEGLEVSDRGRVPADVVRQYQEAHGS
ncbi:Lsr2 family DNA-binding protein [Streptomyces rhizosphaericus]